MQRVMPYILPTLALVLFAVGYYPALELLSKKWLASDDYTHAFFVVPVIIYIIWQKRDSLTNNNGGSFISLLSVAVALSFYLFSLQLQVPSFIFLATVLTIITALIYLGGLGIIKKLAVPILLLFLIIPIPNQILSMLTGTLQLKISEISEMLIRSFGIPMVREGNVLYIKKTAFQVVDACSGIRSLLSMTTLSILIGYYTLTRVSSSVLLFLFSIPAAILINIIRVLVLVLAYYYFQFDLSVGISHTLTGLVLFVFGLALVLAFQRVLELWERKKQYK